MTSPDSWETRTVRLFDAWNRRCPSVGHLAVAALAIGVVSGIALTAGYDVGAAPRSLATLELASRWGRLLRAIHGWSGHLLLLLVLAHTIEHLALRSEARLATGRWVRIVTLGPLLVGLSLSGFILKGDAEAEMARQVVSGLLLRLPGGSALATALLGTGADLQLVYVHHAATLTVAIAWIAAEHGRRIWPATGALLAVLLATVAGAVLHAPALHDGVDPVVKGPWFLVGVQELLHWLTRPGWIWAVAAAPIAAFVVLPRLTGRARSWVLRSLTATLVAYIGVGGWALFFRGPGWSVRLPWAPPAASATAAAALHPLSWPSHDPSRLAVVRNRVEGCLACHDEVTGIEPAHAKEAVGCSGCHLGDPSAPGAAAAHRGMVRVPGNLDTAALTCGQDGCHGNAVDRVRGSLMANVRGMIAVDRWAFGEQPTPDGTATVGDLAGSPADTHLRQMCVGCHLGAPKEKSAPSDELSRGGGCVACHLVEPERRRDAATSWRRFAHPRLSVRVEDERCFGCHARSARISLSYAGWTEVTPDATSPLPVGPPSRRLQDERVVWRTTADVHHEKGMACVDCHSSREVMGDGKPHQHEEQATRLRCTTCHRVAPGRSVPYGRLEPAVQATVRARFGHAPPARFLLEDRTGEPLTNAWELDDGTVEMRGKITGKRHLATKPARACTALAGHERLSCQSCHSTWITACTTCHTQWDARAERIDPRSKRREPGAWIEYDGEPRIGPPALGLFTRGGTTSIEPAAPGMVMTLNGPGVTVPSPLPEASGGLVGSGTRSLRAYALAVPHTTTRAGRSCASCHRDPFALGAGAGTLSLARERGQWAWQFEPAHEPSRDGLPADAWIGFLSDGPAVATRRELAPLDRDTQLRTLAVGACLRCHDPSQRRWQPLYARFRESLARTTPRCEAPPSPPRRP